MPHLGRREPIFETGAGELRARVRQRGALRIGRGIRVAGPTHQDRLAAFPDLDRVPSAREQRGGRFGETLLPRAGDLGDRAVLDLRLLGGVGEGFGDYSGGDELRSHLGQVGDAILDRPPDQWIDELVKLGRANDPDRERAFEQRLLLRDLRRVVAALELVDADDRDDDDSPRPGCGAGSLQVPRRGGEECGRLVLVGRGPRGRVDDGLGPGERLVETLAADHVDTLGARDRDHIVSALLEDLDEVRADSAGGSRDGNLLAHVFGLHRWSFPAAAARRAQFWSAPTRRPVAVVCDSHRGLSRSANGGVKAALKR